MSRVVTATFDVTKAADRARLRGWIDTANPLMGAGLGALTDATRALMMTMLDVLDAADSGQQDTPTT